MLDALLVLFALISLVAMTVGLFKPSLVVRWGNKKTRSRALMMYGGLFVVVCIAFGMTPMSLPKTNSVTPVKPIDQQQAVQTVSTVNASAAEQPPTPVAQPEPVVVTPKSQDPEYKYNHAEARARVIDWVGDHVFPDAQRLALDNGTADGKMFIVKGKSYHRFILVGLHRAADILVDPNTGELLYYDTGNPMPINRWYVQYRRANG